MYVLNIFIFFCIRFIHMTYKFKFRGFKIRICTVFFQNIVLDISISS